MGAGGRAPAGFPVSGARAGVRGLVPVPVKAASGVQADRVGCLFGSRCPCAGVPVHINKLITCCNYCIVHKNKPILGISFIFLYNSIIAYFVLL